MQLNLSETEQEILCEELERLRKAITENEKDMVLLGIRGDERKMEDGALLFLSIQEMICKTRKLNRELKRLMKKGGQDVGGKDFC